MSDSTLWIPILGASGSLVVAGVALFNAERTARGQRRDAIIAARREAAYIVVEWVNDAQTVVEHWTEHRRSLVARAPQPRDVSEQARTLERRFSSVHARVSFVLGPASPARHDILRSATLFSEVAEAHQRVIPIASDRPVEEVLSDWTRSIPQIFDSLSEACALDVDRWTELDTRSRWRLRRSRKKDG